MKIKSNIGRNIIIIFFIFLIGTFIFYKYINRVKNIPLQASNQELSVSQETENKSNEQNIENILLLGVDKEENVTDTIMILSLDKNNNTAKLTSIMRDTYVDNGYDKINKINYSYYYYGVEGIISKINSLFNLDIKKYALINFEGLQNVVDYLGGVIVNITDIESEICGATKSGDVLLNGNQALSFTRIRSIDSDFNRTSRQRKVMLSILNRCRNISLSNLPNVIRDLSSNVQTNLSTYEMISISKYLLTLDINNLEEFRIPIDGTTQNKDVGIYYLYWDKAVNTESLHEFIYRN